MDFLKRVPTFCETIAAHIRLLVLDVKFYKYNNIVLGIIRMTISLHIEVNAHLSSYIRRGAYS